MTETKTAPKDGRAAEVAEAVREALDTVEAQLATLRRQALGAGADGAASVRDALGTRLESLRDEFDALSAGVMKQGRRVVAETEKAVHERPLTTLLAAFGVGMLFAHLFARR